MLRTNFVIDTWEDNDEEIKVKNVDYYDDMVFANRPYQLSQEEKENITLAFNTYDKKKQGFVAIDHVGDIFRLAGQNPSINLEVILRGEANGKGYGVVFYGDLLLLFQKYWKSQRRSIAELKTSVKQFIIPGDTDMISVSDLKNELMSKGEVLDKSDVNSFIKTFDTIGNDKISVDNFMKIMIKNYQKDSNSLHKKATQVKMIMKIKNIKDGVLADGDNNEKLTKKKTKSKKKTLPKKI